MKKHNFSPGPAILPPIVLQKSAQAVENFLDMGLSILEISHRSPEFIEVLEKAEAAARNLLTLSDDYAVIFLTGGASSQFFMTAMNLLNEEETASYVDTGTWSSLAIKEAAAFGKVRVLASSKDQNYTYIPKGFDIPADSKYLHLTSNNTIFGTQYHQWPETSVPIVCDMSSDFLSRPIPVEKFGLIYAGAQKNIGPAGVTMVIVKKDILGSVRRHMPTMLDYHTYINNQSSYNTPPVFPIYVSMLTLEWIQQTGGLAAMHTRNEAKAALLYGEIDANPLFKGTALPEDRSRMNVTFVMTNPDLEKPFLQAAEAAGCVGLKGHRSVGGFRASIYNAMPIESIQVLVDVMRHFANKHS